MSTSFPYKYGLPPRRLRKKERIFEIDFLRGFDLILMIALHFACAVMLSGSFFVWAGEGPEPAGVRALFDVGTQAFQLINSGNLFILEFFFSMMFVFLSGISTGFARSNSMRGMHLMIVAVAMSLVLEFASFLTGANVFIYCGILHAIAISILLYSFVDWLCHGNLKAIFGVAIALSLSTIALSFYSRYPGDGTLWGELAHLIDPSFEPGSILLELNYGDNTIFHPNNAFPPDRYEAWKMLFGLGAAGDDYFPPIQCAAILFLGAVVAKAFYPDRKSFLPAKKRKWAAPLVFLSKHSLYVYLAHMPIIYLVFGSVLLSMGYTLKF